MLIIFHLLQYLGYQSHNLKSESLYITFIVIVIIIIKTASYLILWINIKKTDKTPFKEISLHVCFVRLNSLTHSHYYDRTSRYSHLKSCVGYAFFSSTLGSKSQWIYLLPFNSIHKWWLVMRLEAIPAVIHRVRGGAHSGSVNSVSLG